ncbi:hypothetical protein CMT45_04655 [Elizabethkingia anophelis]|nr:hypothetical protein [Elizabethkingia anophelis]
MNNIILIDDDPQFRLSFVNIAKTRNINVATGKDLDELKKLLPAQSHKFAAVVLDIKGIVDKNQTIEDSSFIPIALQYLDSSIPGFKRFLFTGDKSEYDKFKNLFRKEKVFIKKPDDQEALLDELENCIQNFDLFKFKRENPLIFECFDKNILPSSKEPKLMSIFKNYNENNPSKFTGLIGDIREIHEDIYKSLNSRNKSIVPDKYINANGSPSFSGDFHKHMLGNPDHKKKFIPTTTVYQDSTISQQTKFIHSACSEYLHGASKTSFSISAYTIKALINSLMEIIIWSKQY